MERRLAAILAADVVGYSRLIRADEEGTLAALKALRAELIDPRLAEHNGRIVKLMGDGMLVEFASAVDAVAAAVDTQQAMAEHNAGQTDGKRIAFRVGVNLGDVVIDGDDIHGDGVNVAARLEGLADPGSVCISGKVYEEVRDRTDFPFEDLGEREVKNIDRPIHVWKWSATVPREASAAPGTGEPPPPPDKPSIAVLPFDNMSDDPEQAYFADGIAEDIITDLSKISGLFVIARNSSFAYKGQSLDIRQVCRDLGVRWVLEGSVRKAGARVRINAQLIDGSSGGHLWAERYDRDLEDIFAVQDEVTLEIVGALEIALTPGERTRRDHRGKVDPEAYDLLMRGRAQLYQFTAESLREGRVLLERAIALDPGLAPAYAHLSVTRATEHVNGWNDAGPNNLTEAVDLARKAIAVDEDEPQAYHALALANMWLKNLDEAERAAERAIALDPNYAGAFTALGSIRDYKGKRESAVEVLRQALRLDPEYHIGRQFLGRAQFILGRYEDAEATFERRLIQVPRSDTTRAFLASLYGHTGRPEEARRMWRELAEINPDFSVERFAKILAYDDPACRERFIAGFAKAGLLE